jgi:serine/threonine protein kinase
MALAVQALHHCWRRVGWPLTPPPAAALLQTLLGLNHMHKRKVLHRDVKTLNIFLDENLNVKIGDMGVSRAAEGCQRPAEP